MHAEVIYAGLDLVFMITACASNREFWEDLLKNKSVSILPSTTHPLWRNKSTDSFTVNPISPISPIIYYYLKIL